MQNTDIKFIEMAKIDSKKVLLYSQFIGFIDRTKSEDTHKENFKCNKTKGFLSWNSKKRIRDIVNNWYQSLEVNRYQNNKSQKWLLNQITFCTLTLPAAQLENDKDNKRNLLNRFLIESKRKFKINSYLWVAEKQKSGNIHYHILFDRYIYWESIRSVWNRILDDNGYIENYRQNQIHFHKEGFKVRAELLEKWSYENQYKAYQDGVNNNWSNPNSTDIHKLNKVRNIAAYITKYMTKSVDEEVKEMVKLYKEYGLSDAEIDREKQTYIQEKYSHLLIDGKLWGCSENLQKLKSVTVQCSSDLYNYLDEECIKEEVKRIIKPQFAIIQGIDIENLKIRSPGLYAEYLKINSINYQLLTA